MRLRAAVAEAAAQSVPLHHLRRSGAADAVTEFEALAEELFGPPAGEAPDPARPVAGELVAAVGATAHRPSTGPASFASLDGRDTPGGG